jgi:hypothetical protein
VAVLPAFIPETEIIILDILQQGLLPIQAVQVHKDHQEVQVAEQPTLTQAVLGEAFLAKAFQEAILPGVLHMVAVVVVAQAEQAAQAVEIQQVPVE